MKRVIVVNGKPRAGKDTSIAFMRDILRKEAKTLSKEYSSIDPVRDMVTSMGINVHSKTPADRALLAEIGASVEKHSQFRSKMCVRKVLSFFNTHGSHGVVFLHVREPEVIATIAYLLRHEGIQLITIYVESSRSETVTSNAADMGVADIDYDATLHNHSSLDILRLNCRCLLHSLEMIPEKEV